MRVTVSCFGRFLLIAGLCQAWTGDSIVPQNPKFVLFGDSYTDTGFSVYSSLPDEGNPLGNPSISSDLYSNGINWLKYVTTQYNSTSYYVFDFAKASATTDNAITSIHTNIPAFVDQVSKFYLPHAEDLQTIYNMTSSNTYVGIWFGINDIFSSYLTKTTAELYDLYLNKISISYWSAVQSLYDSGLRNFFFNLVPAMHLSPAVSEKMRSRAREAIELYNSMIIAGNKKFLADNPDATGTVIDIYDLYETIIDKYESYGFSTVDTYCYRYMNGTPFIDAYYAECSYPVNKYFWINTIHVTTDVHNYIGRAVALQLYKVFGLSYNGLTSLEVNTYAVAPDTSAITINLPSTTNIASSTYKFGDSMQLKPYGKVYVEQDMI
ncbi:hypothetical protein V1511DRAFT_31041 [Dipodascopsis uninucleata]